MSIHTKKGKFQIQTATLWYYISTMIYYLYWWMLDTVFVWFCFRVFVFSCVCVFVFLRLELFIVCSANDECWAHCSCAAAPITTGIIVRSCFKRCRKELEDEDCATFLAISIQIYLWSEQRDDCKHAHTHTAPQRRKTATKNEMNSCSGRRHLYCLPAENSHGTFFSRTISMTRN